MYIYWRWVGIKDDLRLENVMYTSSEGAMAYHDKLKRQ